MSTIYYCQKVRKPELTKYKIEKKYIPIDILPCFISSQGCMKHVGLTSLTQILFLVCSYYQNKAFIAHLFVSD